MTYEAVHLVEGAEDVDSFGFIPGESLGTRQAVLRGVVVRESDYPWTYIQCSPQRVSLLLGTHRRAILRAGVDGNGHVADQSSCEFINALKRGQGDISLTIMRTLRCDAMHPGVCKYLSGCQEEQIAA